MHPRLVAYVRDHSRFRPVRWVAEQATAYLQAWWNDNHWDFATNGEAFALRTFATWADGRPVGVWDVGANHGEWAREAHRALPAADVTAFEIVPATAEPLLELAAGAPWLTAVTAGLSAQAGSVQVRVSTTHSETSAISPRLWTEYYEGSAPLEARVLTGDGYLAEVGGAPPHLLKIDTEGHEADVLAGCADLLARPDGPVMIQFEYGETWVPAGCSLAEVQPRLEQLGYAVGRLHPDHVAFKHYERGDDHFRLGNMVAVRDDRLRTLLAG